MPGPSLGTNLSSLVDWSTQFPFVNQFLLSRAWFTQSSTQWNSNQHHLLDLDEHGWVRNFTNDGSTPDFQRVSTVLFTDDEFRRQGRWILEYQGEGEIRYAGAVTFLDHESVDGRHVLLLPDSDYTLLSIEMHSTDPNATGDYLRNMVLYHEDDADMIAAGVQFAPEFLEKIEDFRALRFMDWMATNNSPQSDWADRRMADDARYSIWDDLNSGAPVEVMVALANQIMADPWFTVPHLATEEWIRAFATYVRDHLDPRLVARFEYSNEVWNWGFDQAQWAQREAVNRWGENVEGGWMQWYGMKAAEMARIVAEVFGDETGSRALNVFATQAGWRGLEGYALDAPALVAEGGPPPRTAPFHVYAIAPYFGGSVGGQDMSVQVDAWIAAGEQGYLDAIEYIRNGDGFDSLANIGDMISYHAGVANRLGWQLEAYEGGQHVVDLEGLFGGVQDPAQTAFFITLVQRPEFTDLYLDYFAIWRDAGGGLFAQFSDISQPSRYGSFGIWESAYSANTARADGVEAFRDGVAAWWDDPRSASTFENGRVWRGGGAGETINGRALADQLFGVGGDDVLNGLAGDDVLYGGAGADAINGGDGVDRAGYGADPGGVFAHLGWGWARDGRGDDDALSAIEDLQGSTHADILIGGLGANAVAGGAGNDWIEDVGDGDDMFGGEAGDDVLLGGLGDDMVSGGDGVDWILGQDGADSLDGGGGVDIVFGGAGNDVLDGGSDGDALIGEDGDDVLGGGGGNDWAYGGAGADTLRGDDGDDLLAGEDGNDGLAGNLGNDFLFGGYGDDTLAGGDGADWIDGSFGNDSITGGLGADTLFGGSGDRFVYPSIADSPIAAADVIAVFWDGDVIDVSAIDADGAAANGDTAFSLVADFTGAAGQARVSESAFGSTVWFDVDGDLAADMAIIVLGRYVGAADVIL